MGLRVKVTKKYFRTVDGYKIYLVDGSKVKIKYNMDFTEGSNFMVANYIPKGEIWIDNIYKHKPAELHAIILHEIYEVNKMKKGMSYNKAHPLANKIEKNYRIKLLRK